MGKFEIEGYAKRKVKCDLAIVHITFRGTGKKPNELSKKVMDDCDSFIKEVSKIGIKPKDIQYEADRTDTNRYNNETVFEMERKIIIRVPFDVRVLNRIQGALQYGKYNYTRQISKACTYSTRRSGRSCTL
ncbi:MAG: DUF541 domain-containing protein [Butyrivibrio sp.]|nr:DUF541 domain-containing protein [Butyrivibrio sp.]